jgi:hypothetical protein
VEYTSRLQELFPPRTAQQKSHHVALELPFPGGEAVELFKGILDVGCSAQCRVNPLLVEGFDILYATNSIARFSMAR